MVVTMPDITTMSAPFPVSTAPAAVPDDVPAREDGADDVGWLELVPVTLEEEGVTLASGLTDARAAKISALVYVTQLLLAGTRAV